MFPWLQPQPFMLIETLKTFKMPRKARKIFVLDTSVILYDYHAVMSFQEHDIAIPIVVLEEIDTFKKGNTLVNMHAREFIRQLDKLSDHNMLNNWISLVGINKGKLTVIRDTKPKKDANETFGTTTNDHRILNAVLHLKEKHKTRTVVLVTKDINLRVKARALEIDAEDYETGKVKNPDHLDVGYKELKMMSAEVIDELYASGQMECSKTLDSLPKANQYLILQNGSKSALAFYNKKTGFLERIVKSTAYGITPKNAEQTFALHAVMNPDIRLVSLSGAAGTGKTLLALAGALATKESYRQIYITRPIVPLSNKDIGYLPGDAKQKINPYMQPLWDNLELIKSQFKDNDKEFKRIRDMVAQDKIQMAPLAYIRGRTLSNVFFIVDEAQNLTPHEIKTIITRAGENTKIVFTGDIFQIDTPYLDSQSNGLSYLISRISDHPLHAHINLKKGERSELANLASHLL